MARTYKKSRESNLALRAAIIVLCIVIVFGVLTAVTYGSKGFTDWKYKEWFNNWGKGEITELKKPDNSEPDDNKITAVKSVKYARGITLAAESAEVEAYTFSTFTWCGIRFGYSSDQGLILDRSSDLYQGSHFLLDLTGDYIEEYLYNFYAENTEIPYIQTVKITPTYEYQMFAKTKGTTLSADATLTYKYTANELSVPKTYFTEKLHVQDMLGAGFRGEMLEFSFYHETSSILTPLGEYRLRVITTAEQTKDPDWEVVYPMPETPVKEGHTFIGWYYDEAFTKPYVEGTPIYEDTKLYAKFEVNQYTVIFDSAGGNTIASITTNWNTTITPAVPQKTGYDFIGWYYEDGTKYTNQGIKENTKLTAQWKRKTVTVQFYVEGSVYETIQVEYGAQFSSVVKAAKAKNLVLLSVMTAEGEQPIDKYTDTVVTEDYTVQAEKGDNIFAEYPWIFAPVGGVFALMVIGYYMLKAKRRY